MSIIFQNYIQFTPNQKNVSSHPLKNLSQTSNLENSYVIGNHHLSKGESEEEDLLHDEYKQISKDKDGFLNKKRNKLSALSKSSWTYEEDSILLNWIRKEGPRKWALCARMIKGRNGKQCRERWFNGLNPEVKKGEWSIEEDFLIYFLYSKMGSKWSKIALYFKERTENSIKNRFYSSLRKIYYDQKRYSRIKSSLAGKEKIGINELIQIFPLAKKEKEKELQKSRKMTEEEFEKYQNELMCVSKNQAIVKKENINNFNDLSSVINNSTSQIQNGNNQLSMEGIAKINTNMNMNPQGESSNFMDNFDKELKFNITITNSFSNSEDEFILLGNQINEANQVLEGISKQKEEQEIVNTDNIESINNITIEQIDSKDWNIGFNNIFDNSTIEDKNTKKSEYKKEIYNYLLEELDELDNLIQKSKINLVNVLSNQNLHNMK